MLVAAGLAASSGLLACSDVSGIGQLRSDLMVPQMIDFGDVQVGILVPIEIEIKNDGNVGVSVPKIVPADTFSAADYEFKVPTAAFALAPSDSKKMTVTFQALAASMDPVTSSFQIFTDMPDPMGADGKKVITVNVRGRGVKDGLLIEPSPVDFGVVLIGSTKNVDVKLTNNLSMAVQISTKLGLDGKPLFTNEAGHGIFALAGTIPVDGSLGGMMVEPHGSITVTLAYTPDPAADGHQDKARWTVRNCDDQLCEYNLELIGKGTGSALHCDPAAVDFGLVNPGRTKTQAVTCTNVAPDPVLITGWNNDPGTASEFTIPAYAGNPGMLAPMASFMISTSFMPTLTTLHSGLMPAGGFTIVGHNPQANRDLQPVHISLAGLAGGPTIEVQPMQLDFGSVALHTTEDKRLLLSNTGFADLIVTMISSSAPEFTPTPVAITLATGTSTVVTVAFAPTTAGMASGDLVLASNDPGSPQVHVPLTGIGVDLPPCVYTLTPTSLNFGVVTVSETKDLSVQIQNVGTNDCLLNNIDLVPTPPPVSFILPSGPETGIRLAPMATKTIGVRFNPMDAGNLRDNLGFYISDPMNPNPLVPLFGYGEASISVTCPPDVTTPAGTPVILNAPVMTIGTTLSSYEWTITSSPAGGLGTPNQWSPDPPTAATETFLPYIVGRYTIHVVAIDSRGNRSSCDTHVNAEGHGLRVELTWDGTGDVDLHVHNSAATPWFSQSASTDDCYYSEPQPVWDMSSMAGAGGNPALDFDNTTANGPENTRIDTTAAGAIYTIAAHNYARAQGRTATVQIFCGGGTLPVATFSSHPLQGVNGGQCGGGADGDFWKVATVTFTSASACTVTPINTYVTTNQACTAF